MEMDIITRADLQAFRIELLNDLRCLLRNEDHKTSKPWLRNQEVCQLLNISLSTLKRMRIGGKVKSSKIGGIHYYAYRDIEKLLSGSVKPL